MATSTAQRNIEMAREAYAAFERNDIQAVMATIADDCVWHGGARGPLAGDYKVKSAIAEFFVKFAEVTEGTYKAKVHDILGSDEHTVVLGTMTVTRNGKTREDQFADIVHNNAAGQVTEFWRTVVEPFGLLEFLE